MGFEAILALVIFILVFIAFSFELVDKAVAVMIGVIILLLFGIIDESEMISFVDFETLFLLFGMMLLVDTAKKSGVFSWLHLKLTEFTAGNPLLILIFLLTITAVFSAFLDNVTTIIIVLPLAIQLIKGMGLDPKLYVIFIVIFSNIGGTLTLVGDPPNILIGSTMGFSFLDFIVNLWMPILFIALALFTILIIRYWHVFKPIHCNMLKLFTSQLLIRKIKNEFQSTKCNWPFAIISVVVIVFTLICFLFPSITALISGHALRPGFIAILGAMLLLVLAYKYVSIEDVLHRVEWNALVFFGGLFILVGALEKLHILGYVSDVIIEIASSPLELSLLVVWISGFASAFMDNIPFVAVMIPVIQDVIATTPFDRSFDTDILWWSLSLGACLGGNGTLVGASANLVAVSIAKKEGVNISFLQFFKYGFVTMIGSLIISSLYIMWRIM